MPKYDNDPIIEAICEIRFLPTGTEDATLTGLMFSRLESDFPTKRAATVFGASPDFANPAQQTFHAENRTQFVSADGKEIIAVATNLISVSRLAPYPTWEEFVPLIQKAVTTYLDINPAERVQQVGLRYINQIVFPESSVNLNEWLTYYVAGPALGPDDQTSVSGFLATTQTFFEDNREFLLMQLSNSSPGPSGEATCILDIGYTLAQVGAISVSEIDAWLWSAHKKIETYFEASITPALRDRFNKK